MMVTECQIKKMINILVDEQSIKSDINKICSPSDKEVNQDKERGTSFKK